MTTEQPMTVIAVLLAAGQGTRMKSSRPKVLHPLCGKPMIWYTLEAVRQASTETPVVVVGHGAEQVQAFVADAAGCAMQHPQLGTAHAVQQAEPLAKGKADLVLIAYADMPLLRAETLRKLVETQQANPGPLTLLTVMADDPRGFGRIVRNADGSVQAIVEEVGATPEQLSIRELNVGAYCARADWLWDALRRIEKDPHKGEYYLTDAAAIASRDGLHVQAVLLDDRLEAIGINTRVHLAEAEAAMRQRINRAHMLNGVSMQDPASTYIETGVLIGTDTVVMPNTHIQGKTVIGQGSIIGPNAIIKDSTIGNRCKVLAAVVDGAV